MRLFAVLMILAGVYAASAQSGRVGPATATPAVTAVSDRTVERLFDEANTYTKTKFAEYSDKNVKFSEKLQEQTKKEQKQLAAKNAAIAGVRTTFAGDDLYYLGLLHWIAGNLDGTTEAFRRYIATDSPAADKAQTARSLVAVISAKQGKFADGEAALAAYLKAGPVKLSEHLRMESEFAKAYQTAREFTKMAPHAVAAYAVAKSLLKSGPPTARGLDEMLDTGMLVFEAHSGSGEQAKADAALDDLRARAKDAQSPSFYYFALDKKITYMVETGRKPAAMEFYLTGLINATKDFTDKRLQSDVIARLKRRETHYKLLGGPAPEFTSVDQWFPGQPRTFADLKGKVVLIDFWATWCGPCFEAFPSIIEWQQDHGKDGFEVLGVTRYYGMQVGAKDNPSEIAMLKAFRVKQSLNYDLVVARDQSIQYLYGAAALPTAVLVDRKGIIRYIETGTNPTRLDEMRAMILKLLAEK